MTPTSRKRAPRVEARPPGAGRPDRVVEVYEELRDLVVRGRLAPGARLVEAQVVSRLGASRTSVRGALQRLQQEGFVWGGTTGLKGRIAVAPLTSTDAVELFQVVAEIEGLAAENASQLALTPRQSLVADLNRVNEEYRRIAAAPRPDGDRLFALDTDFHWLYVKAGAGPRLLGLHLAIKPQIERYVRIYQTALTEAIQTSVVEHAAVVAEIATGSGRGAQDAVRTNWRNAAARLRLVIDARGESGSW